MQWSRYNILFEKEGVYLFYNSLSNAFAELDKETFEQLSQFKPGDIVDVNDIELVNNLARMKAIVNNDADELLKLKYTTLCRRFDSSFVNLTINPTLACNFACPYCFEGEHKNVYMTDKVEDGIVEFIKRKTSAKRIDVTWFGGEPLLAFPRIVSLTKKIRSLGLPYSAGMITNGYLLNENTIAQLNELDIKRLQITIDGLGEEHNKRRFLKGGSPTFEKIAQNLDLLNTFAPEIRVNIRVNIDANNMDNFINVFNYFYKKKYLNIIVTPAFVEDISEGASCTFNSIEKFHFLIELFKKYGLNFNSFYPSYTSTECSIRNYNVAVIGPEGEIYKCWNDVGKSDRIVGDIFGKTTNEALLLRYLVGEDPFDDNNCRKCVLLPVCSGGCPYHRIAYKGELDYISKVCPLMKLDITTHLWAHYLSKTGRKFNV